MDILVVGAGAEDETSPMFGHLLATLKAAGKTVEARDPSLCEHFAVRGTSRQQWEWMISLPGLELVVIGPMDEEPHDFFTAAAAERGLPTQRVTARDLMLRSAELGASGESAPPPHMKKAAFVVRGDATGLAIEQGEKLVREGADIAFYGRGWEASMTLLPRAHGPIPYSALPGVLSGSVALCFAQDDVTTGITNTRAVLDAALLTVPALAFPEARIDPILEPGVHWVAAESAAATVPVVPLAAARDFALGNLWRDHAALAPADLPRIRVTREGPKVSFITAIYGVVDYLAEAMDSMLAQTFQDFEIVALDDGSTDGSRQVLERYASDPRVRIIDQPNGGQCGRYDFPFGTAQAHARGEYFAHMDGDDIAMPDRLERQLAVFEEEPRTDIVHGAGIAMDARGNLARPVFALLADYDASSFARALLIGNLIAHPTQLMRRSIYDDAGESGGFAPDYRQWFAAAAGNKVARYMPSAVTKYRIHETNASSGSGAAESVRQGNLTRRDALTRASIVDLFPALAFASIDNTMLAAAYVEMGALCMRLMPDPELAAELFEQALLLSPNDARIRYNLASVLAGFESGPKADAEVQRWASAAEITPESVAANALVVGRAISAAPFTLPTDIAAETLCWDGTPRSLTRVLLSIDGVSTQALSSALESYFAAFEAGDEVELVITSAQRSQQEALDMVLQLLGTPFDFDNAPAITIEDWAYPEFVPTQRFAAIFMPSLGSPVQVQHHWQAQLAAVAAQLHRA